MSMSISLPTDLPLPTAEALGIFRESVMANYYREGRRFAWRETSDPWKVFVSEIMLQQTQTARVVPKYEQWFEDFPAMQDLADASLEAVYGSWKGLGYNNRALRLREAARQIIAKHNGAVPCDEKALRDLPGVGVYTARAVMAFAYDIPGVFLETNIRSALIFQFYHDRENVPDSVLEKVAALVLDTVNPRRWYYAFMDYGVFIKKREPNPSRKSAGYSKQTRFEGSLRQARGGILSALSTKPNQSARQLAGSTGIAYALIGEAAAALVAEGLVRYDGVKFSFGD